MIYDISYQESFSQAITIGSFSFWEAFTMRSSKSERRLEAKSHQAGPSATDLTSRSEPCTIRSNLQPAPFKPFSRKTGRERLGICGFSTSYMGFGII